MAQVTEKNADVVHDFHQDALKLQLAGDWLKVACPYCALCLPASFINPRHMQSLSAVSLEPQVEAQHHPSAPCQCCMPHAPLPRPQMVCHQALQLHRRLQACGTTLGADNGIGVAAALALLSQPETAKLPPLEALFTVDEETGLTGAFELDPCMLSGTSALLGAAKPHAESGVSGNCLHGIGWHLCHQVLAACLACQESWPRHAARACAIAQSAVPDAQNQQLRQLTVLPRC